MVSSCMSNQASHLTSWLSYIPILIDARCESWHQTIAQSAIRSHLSKVSSNQVKSGNPKGRLKGLKNLSTDLQEELEQKILITEANKSQKVTKQRAMSRA